MGNALIVGVWACLVTLAATYGGSHWRSRPGEAEDSGHTQALQVRAIKPVTVPIIANGVLKGYVSAEFNLVGAKADAHGGADLDPESFVMDEAFRLIYGETKIDFTHMEKADLTVLTSQLTANVNRRMGRDVVKETLVKNFHFVARDDIPR